MISLCGPWQQVRRALSLVADMRARSLECGFQAWHSLLPAIAKTRCAGSGWDYALLDYWVPEHQKILRKLLLCLCEAFVRLNLNFGPFIKPGAYQVFKHDIKIFDALPGLLF